MQFFGRQGLKEELNSPLPICLDSDEEPLVCNGNTNVVSPDTGAPEAPSPATKPLPVAFKNGKVSFSEKKLGLERHPSVIAAVFQFHQHIAQRKQNGQGGLPLTTIPNEHKCLIAMLVQERDASMASLVRSIESQLCPVVFGEKRSGNSSILVSGAVEAVVADIAELRNYGVSLASLRESCGATLSDVPHSLSIQRWEVRDLTLLPEDVREVVLKRRQQRQDAHAECARWFQSLDSETQGQILTGTLKKLKLKHPSTTEKHTPMDEAAIDKGTSESMSSKKASQGLRGQKSLQTFFATERVLDNGKAQTTAPICNAEPKSYYHATFLPFHLRQHTTMYQHEPPASFDPSSIDNALSYSHSARASGDPTASEAESKRYLQQFISASRRLRAGSNDNKTLLSARASDGAELDAAELYMLRLRQSPVKCFHFHGSRRPDYWGTWSRALRGVGPRRPFHRDTDQLDYDVDSDAEWEAEEEGEDLRSEEDDDDEDSEDDEDDEDDDDFDEHNNFVAGDINPQVVSEEGESNSDPDSDEESNFNSEDEEMEDIDPSEEVCESTMDVDDPIELTSGRRKPTSHTTGGSAVLVEEKRERPPRRRPKILPLTPLVVGLLWDTCAIALGDDPASDSTKGSSELACLTVCALGASLPLCIGNALGKCEGSAGPPARKPVEIADADLYTLVNAVHGSSLGVLRLVEILRPQIPGISKAQIERLIHEHAVKEKRPPASRYAWYVKEHLVDQARAARLPCAVDTAGVFEDEGTAAKRQRTSEAVADNGPCERPICQ